MTSFQISKLTKLFLYFLFKPIRHPIPRRRRRFGATIMLGKVRASSISSLELLEMERPPPKIVKHDSLSIYESTLLKLKQGSRCNLGDSAPMEASCVVTECCSPNSSFPSPSCNIQSTVEEWGKRKSIIYLFSKYKSSQQLQTTDWDSSCSVSPASSN